MKDNLGWKWTNQKLHSNDAFIRIGILQSKILRKQKTMPQMMSEINKISSWNIQKNKNKLFVQRIRTFAKNVGFNQLLAMCLSKFVQLFPSIPPQPRVSILYLISKCHAFFGEAQVLSYLSEAVVLMGKDILNFQQYGIYCCLQFCKLTQTQSQFHMVFQRCYQCLLAKLSTTRLQTLVQKIGPKQHGRRSQQFKQMQETDYKNYKNIKFKSQQRVCIQQLLQLFLIGSIKFLSQKQRQQYENKLQNWVDELYHCDQQLFSVPPNQVVKQYKRSLNQRQLSRIRIRKLTQSQKQYHINLQHLPKRVYIPSIIFENKIKSPQIDRQFLEQEQYRQRNLISNIRNTDIEMQKLKIKTLNIIKNKKTQLQIQNKVYQINYQKRNKQIQNVICCEDKESIQSHKIYVKNVEKREQNKQNEMKQEEVEQIVESGQKISRKTSVFYSKNGQFGTTCDSAQFNSFQFDDFPQLIIKVQSQNEQEDCLKEQQSKQQQIQSGQENNQIQDVDQILADCDCPVDFDQVQNNSQQFNLTNSCQLSEIKQIIQQIQDCKYSQQLQEKEQNNIKKQDQNALILSLLSNELQQMIKQIQTKQALLKIQIKQKCNRFQVYDQNSRYGQKLFFQPIQSYNYIVQISQSQQKSVQVTSGQNSLNSQKISQFCQTSNKTLSFIEEDIMKQIKRQKQKISLVGLHTIQLKHLSAELLNDNIYYFLRLDPNWQKTEIIGYLSQQQQFKLEKSRLVLIFPFNILQSRSNIEQKIKNIDNYIVLFEGTATNTAKSSLQVQQNSNKMKQNGKNRIIIYGLWLKIIESKLKLYINGGVVILHYILYQIFYEDATFDAIICISQFCYDRYFQLKQCNQMSKDSSWKEKGKIRFNKINVDLWLQVENNIETIIGYCIHGEGQSYAIKNQQLNQQYIKNIIL